MKCPSFAFDSYLPAFHIIVLEFDVSQISVQQTLSHLLGASIYGFAQLFILLIRGIVTNAVLSGRLAVRLSPPRTIYLGYTCMFASAIFDLPRCLRPTKYALARIAFAGVLDGNEHPYAERYLLLLDLSPAMWGFSASLAGFVQFAFSGFNARHDRATSLALLASGMASLTVARFALWVHLHH